LSFFELLNATNRNLRAHLLCARKRYVRVTLLLPAAFRANKRFSPVAVYPSKHIIHTETRKIAYRNRNTLPFVDAPQNVILSLPCTRPKKLFLTGTPCLPWIHLKTLFSRCRAPDQKKKIFTRKIKNWPTATETPCLRWPHLKTLCSRCRVLDQKIIYTDYRKIALRQKGHLAFRGCTSKR